VSEGKLSRVFGGIDPMDPQLESMLREIVLGNEEQAMNYNDKKGESNE
jgi:hypothetical protein